MSFFVIKSLRQRIFLFLLVPATVLLLFMGTAGFFLARNALLKEWKESSVLKLERAAHYIDMRLEKPIGWMEMFNATGGMQEGTVVQHWIIQEMKQLRGVIKVSIRWTGNPPEAHGSMMMTRPRMHDRDQQGMQGMMHFHMGRISEVTLPRYDAHVGKQTVSLISNLKDESGKVVGVLEVTMLFHFLLQDMNTLGWWQSNFAGLVDNTGRYLARTQATGNLSDVLGQSGDPAKTCGDLHCNSRGRGFRCQRGEKLIGCADCAWKCQRSNERDNGTGNQCCPEGRPSLQDQVKLPVKRHGEKDDDNGKRLVEQRCLGEVDIVAHARA